MAGDHDDQDTNEQRGRIAVEKAIEREPQWLIGRLHRCADLTQEEKRFLEGRIIGKDSPHYKPLKRGPPKARESAANRQEAAYLARWLRHAEGWEKQAAIDAEIAAVMGTTIDNAKNWRAAGQKARESLLKGFAVQRGIDELIEEKMRIFNEQRLAGFPDIDPDEWRPDGIRG